MKLKTDFVTNSSSASYIIDKRYLNKIQIMCIHDHIETGYLLTKLNSKLDLGYDDKWVIEEKLNVIKCSTAMTNFDMKLFLKTIGVPRKAIKVEYEN